MNPIIQLVSRSQKRAGFAVVSALVLGLSVPAVSQEQPVIGTEQDFYATPVVHATLGEDVLNSLLAYYFRKPLDTSFTARGANIRVKAVVQSAYFDFESPAYGKTCADQPTEFGRTSCNELAAWRDQYTCITDVPRGLVTYESTASVCRDYAPPYPADIQGVPLVKRAADAGPLPEISQSYFFIKGYVLVWINGIPQPEITINRTRYLSSDDFEIDPETEAIRLKNGILSQLPPPLADQFSEPIDRVINRVLRTYPIPTHPDGRLKNVDFGVISTKSSFRSMLYRIHTTYHQNQITLSIERPFRFEHGRFAAAQLATKNGGKNFDIVLQSNHFGDVPSNATRYARIGGVASSKYRSLITQIRWKPVGGNWNHMYGRYTGLNAGIHSDWATYEPDARRPLFPYKFLSRAKLPLDPPNHWWFNYTGDSVEVSGLLENSRGGWIFIYPRDASVPLAGQPFHRAFRWKVYEDPNFQGELFDPEDCWACGPR